jgi:hypothetical protein
VAKIGRNDPCPCGSGKKYKYCCLRKETEGKFEAIGRERSWETMMDKLMDFSREARFQQEIQVAFDLYWNRTYTLDQVNSLEPAQVMSFLDWYAHDYRTSADGRRIVEIFRQEQEAELSAQELAALRADSEALFSAVEITQVEEGESLQLLDVFQGRPERVQYVPSLQGLQTGQVLLARVVDSGEFHRFSWVSHLVPPEVVEELKGYIEDMYVRYQEEHYQAPWAQFLRERSYLFNQFMLKVRGELPQATVLLPYQEAGEAESRPLVLIPGQTQPEERPSVLVPGVKEPGRPRTVLVPGQDR